MQAADIEITVLNDAEINLANDFFNSIYKSGRDEEKFLWEFRKSPALPGIYIVAKDRQTGKVVGCQGAIPVDVITGKGETVLTAKSEDTLVHPDYRGLNIFENMYKLLFDQSQKRGIQYIWGFTYAKKPFTKLGFDTPYIVSQSLMAFDILGAARYLLRYNRTKTLWSKTKMLALCGFSKVVSLKRNFSADSHLKGISHSTLEKRSMEDNNFLAGDILSGTPDHFMIKQEVNYLRWRITDNPYHDEILNVGFYVESKKVAHVLLNHHEDGVWYLIQDLYSTSLTEIQKTAILVKAVNILKGRKKANLRLIRTWDFSHNAINKAEVAVRKKAGFTQIKHGAVFVWKGLGGMPLLDPHHFILSRIASEGKI
ncbi:MAG TPA: GNAT family N-acetyltransferase [Cyclobacteriaceae bacterium]|nr:GNAT family N-acetyltransferase [Cyclobacteriaceae bacterium]